MGGRLGRGSRRALAVLSAMLVLGVATPTLAASKAGKVSAGKADKSKPGKTKLGKTKAAGSKKRAQGPAVLRVPGAQMVGIDWRDLAGWDEDDHESAFATFLSSCRALTAPSAKRARDNRLMRNALANVCRRALSRVPLDQKAAQAFFEENFRPVQISKVGEAEGFVTGYYEPIVEGSRVPTREFQYPLYRRPGDLLHATAKRRKAFPNSGKVVRHVGKGKARKAAPYFDRAEIEDGALAGRKLEIVWLKDPIDAFFIHIQGSARVRLEDGAVVRVNYDAHNGHRYLPVGRVLIERGIVPKDEMSMDRIREWMMANPEEGRELRRMNKSFVFFRVTGLADHDEAIGAQGVALTAGRSIAVDKALHVYGTPFFIEADLPIASADAATKFRRLMVAQDTGSAIVGPARADVYFGAGAIEGRISGRLRHNARFAILAPREIDPIRASAFVPLPIARPAVTAATRTEGAAIDVSPPVRP